MVLPDRIASCSCGDGRLFQLKRCVLLFYRHFAASDGLKDNDDHCSEICGRLNMYREELDLQETKATAQLAGFLLNSARSGNVTAQIALPCPPGSRSFLSSKWAAAPAGSTIHAGQPKSDRDAAPTGPGFLLFSMIQPEDAAN